MARARPWRFPPGLVNPVPPFQGGVPSTQSGVNFGDLKLKLNAVEYTPEVLLLV